MSTIDPNNGIIVANCDYGWGPKRGDNKGDPNGSVKSWFCFYFKGTTFIVDSAGKGWCERQLSSELRKGVTAINDIKK